MDRGAWWDTVWGVAKSQTIMTLILPSSYISAVIFVLYFLPPSILHAFFIDELICFLAIL